MDAHVWSLCAVDHTGKCILFLGLVKRLEVYSYRPR